jgi:hypothetical protein
VRFERMALGLLAVAFAFRAALIPAQDDTFWTLRAGAELLRSGHVPLVDSYSFTAAGAPWPNHEWLWQAFAYACHRAGGLAMLTAAAAVLMLVAVWLVARLTVGSAMTRFALLAVGVGLSSCVWSLRPHLVTLLGVALLGTLLVRERWWPIPLLFLCWANAHGGVALGGLVLAAATVAAAVRAAWRRAPEDRRRVGALAAVLALSAVATVVTPLGLGVFHFIWTSTARLASAEITEWRPASPTDPVGAACWLAVVAFAGLVVWRRRSLATAPWSDWALCAGALALVVPALRSVRNVAPFALLATAAASRLLGPGFRLRSASRSGPAAEDHPRLNLALFSIVSLAALGLVVAAYARPHPFLGWRPLTSDAIAAIRGCDGPLYNHYNDGGRLIWFVPERPVFIDSRQDPYPLPFLLEFIAVEQGRAPYRPMFDRWGIRCAFLGVDSPTVPALARDGWGTRYHDDTWALLAAPAAR